MVNKIRKSLKITLKTLWGLVLIGVLPFTSYASSSPNVTTNSATRITSESAIFNMSIRSDNTPTVWFEYGSTPNLNNFISINAYRPNLDSGYNGTWTAEIHGLYPSTTYYFRAVAQNKDGRAYGNIRPFTTNHAFTRNNYPTANSPASLTALTESASLISNDRVQLNSLILNSENIFSNVWFEWGTTANLGSKTVPISIGNSSSVRHINTMTGLVPGTTYYFRAVAENDSWRNIGSILSFTTSGTKPNTNTTTYISPAVTNISTVTKTEINKINTPTETIEKTGAIKSAKSSLEANVAKTNSFFPANTLGWLILIILILVLILLSKHLYRQFSNTK